jgi:lipopolysaccharide export system permease protein
MMAAMRTYLRYLLVQLALPTLIATLALAGAVWLSQSLRFVDLIVNKGLPVTTFLYLTMLLFPSLLLVILPFALFSAVLFVYHRLTLESELTVMKAVGLSNWQLALPCLVLAGVVTAAGYAISLYFMPLAYRGFKDLQYEIRRDFSHVLLQPGVFNTPLRHVTVYIREQAGDGSLRGILVHDERIRAQPVTMMAEQGFLVQGEGGPLFVLETGSRQELDVTRGVDRPGLSILHFERYALDLAAAAQPPDARSRQPEELWLHELLNPQAGSESQRRELIAEGHKRLTWPLNATVFALVGLAALLSHRFDRRGPWPRSLIAVVIALGLQAASMGAANLAARSLSAVPLIYAVTFIPALIAIAVIGGWTPRRRATPRAAPAT